MSGINILRSKVIDHKFFFPILAIFALFIYFPIFNSIPFGDDFVYIFNNVHITGAPHPFVYWQYGSESFKSWPLSFSFLWLFYKLFGEHYFVYRIINLGLHITNAGLIYKITNHKFPRVSKIIAALFLFHPLAVENIYWIFQIKTLLSLLFLLLSIIFIQKFNTTARYKFYASSLLFFLFSLLSKSSAILAPFALLFFFKEKNNFRRFSLILPFLVFSSLLGIENLKGVTSTKGELIKIESFQQDYFKKNQDFLEQNKTSITSPPAPVETHYVKDIPLVDSQKYIESIKAYLKSIFNFEPFALKLSIILSSLAFYLKASFGFNINQIVYPDLNLKNLSSYIYMFIPLILSIFLIRLDKKYYKYLTLSFFLFLPISGLVYVPYMQYSFVADHWFYPSLIFVILLLCSALYDSLSEKKSNIIFLFLFSLFFLQSASYTFRLSDSKKFFYSELERHNNRSQIITEYLIEMEKKDKNFTQALSLSQTLFEYATSKRDTILENILYLAQKIKNAPVYFHFLEKKSILFFKNGSLLQSKDILLKIPQQYRSERFYFLLNLYEHAERRINPEHLDLLNQFLKK